jgi:uncharacterized delta-60 repeat protein
MNASKRSLQCLWLSVSLIAPAVAHGQILFSEDFDSDHTANWTVNASAGTHPVNLFFDYSTVGIPSAPNSGGTTRGAKLQANTAGGVLGGVSISPVGQGFGGNYRLRLDMWMNYNGPLNGGGNGSTQLGGAGVGTKGTTSQWAGGVYDCVFFCATGDGGIAGTDYRAYSVVSNNYVPASGIFNAGTGTAPDVRDNGHPYYSVFTSKTAPAAQLALFPQQTGSSAVGSQGFVWRDVAITRTNNKVNWTIDGRSIATVDTSSFSISTNILLNYFDFNAASSTDPNAGTLLFSLFDNVRVEALPASFTMTGGGVSCQGDGGVAVGLSGTETGVDYLLRTNGVYCGVTVAGTGNAISFGNQTNPRTYSVFASNAVSALTHPMNGSVSVVVNVPPAITGGPTPANATNFVGSSTSFSVSATGSGLSYQWYRDGVPLVNGGNISGATSNILTLAVVQITDTAAAGHGYRCMVSGSCGSPALSEEAALNVLAPVNVSPPLTQAWVARYNGQTSSSDGASKVVVDSDGNVIVAGNSTNKISGSDIVTLKYSSAGVLLWSNRYDGPVHLDDTAFAVALDASDNVVVGGNSFNGLDTEACTLKYAGTDGALLWEKRYVGPNNAMDSIQAVAVDAGGNVLVGGASDLNFAYAAQYAGSNGATLWEKRFSANAIKALSLGSGNLGVAGGTYLAKLNAGDGSLVWERRFTGTNFNAVAFDANGDLLAAGETQISVGDFFTAKFAAADGTPLWSKAYNGPGANTDVATALALDANGNAIVTGLSVGSTVGSDFYTAKYASVDGALLWEKRYSPGPSTADGATAIAVDVNGNAVVTGYSTGIGVDFYTAKYAAADGALLWERRYNSPANGNEQAAAVAFDGNGNVIVAGVSPGTNTMNDFYTAKYAAADGALLWEHRFDSPGNDYDYARAVAVDENGDVLVTGQAFYPFATNANRMDIYTAKYSGATGALLWSVRYNGPGNGNDDATAVAVDNSGNIIIAGTSSGPISGDFYVAKYAGTNGALLWEKTDDIANDSVRSLALDSDGNILVTGSAYDGFANQMVTAKYASADGTRLWQQIFFDFVSFGVPTAIANSVAVDGNGNAVVTGYAGNPTPYLYTVKYAGTNGSILWEKSYTSAGNAIGQSGDVALDASGNVFIAAWGSSTGGGDYYTAKYAAANGALIWEKRYNGPGNDVDIPSSIVVDANGDAVVTGSSRGSGTGNDYYTAKYSGSSGALLWEKRFTSAGFNSDVATSVALDASGNVVITGNSFGGTNGSPTFLTDYYTLLYDGVSGNQLWSARYDGPAKGPETTHALVVTTTGDVIVTGESDGDFTSDIRMDYATVKYARFAFQPHPQVIATGGSNTFAALGGQPPFQFSIATNNSGGTINTNTGLYIAGNNCGADTITITGSNGIAINATIRVLGQTPPSILCPSNITVQSDRVCGTTVTFAVTAMDGCGLPLAPIVSPPSGALFPAGITTVNCSAVDDLGRSTTCSFTVTVENLAPPCTAMPSNAVAFWRGDYNAADALGTSHGVINGAVAFNSCSIGGGGFNFTTLGSYVSAPFTSAVQQTNITVEAWVFAQGTPTTQAGIAGTWNDLTGVGTAWRRTFLLWSYQGKIEFLCGVGGTIDRATDPVSLPTNTWVHLAATYDGNSIRLYRNGTEVASKAYAGILNTNDQPFLIGRSDAGGDGSDYWRGMIDDVTVYSRALSSNEIAAIYAAGSTGKCLGAVANNSPIVANPIPDQTGAYGAPFSIAFAANTFTDPDAGQTLSYGASGLPAGITFAPATRTFSGTPTAVGTATVTVTATDNGSPALSTNDVFDIVIAKAPLTVTANNQSRTYAETNPPLPFSYSAFVLGETAAVLDTPPAAGTPATNGSAVGPYPITIGGGADHHYELSYVGGTLNITLASLTVTAFDTNRVCGTPNPPLTGSLVGVAWSDNITSTFTTTATLIDPPGTYPITPVLNDPDGKLGNYSVTTNMGTLTVVGPPELSITTGGGGTIILSWPASYAAFVLEFAESLTSPIHWQPVTSGITESGGIKSYTVTPDLNVEGRLYRLRLQ